MNVSSCCSKYDCLEPSSPFIRLFTENSLSSYFVRTNDACLQTTYDATSGVDCFAF